MIIFFFWAIAFVTKGILSYYILEYTIDRIETNDLLKIILIVIDCIVTDIGPCLLVLEVKFIDLFKKLRKEK